MLIGMRNAFMTRRLPYDAELEYLESTGTQWIDTGVIPDTVDLDINIALTVIAQGHLFGSRINSDFSPTTNLLWSSYGSNAGQFRKDWIAENAYLTLSTTAPNIIGLHSSASGSSIVHDGATLTGGVKTTNSLSLYLFAVNNNGTAATGKLKIYQCKITKGSTLVRDFIPVRKGTTGYMYDRVSKRLFGNAGTGDFVLGPDVVPVEWLEFTGTQRLLTDIPANVYAQNLKTSISYQLTSTASRQLSGCGSSYFEFCSPGSFVQADASYPADLNRHTLDFIGWLISNSSRVLYDGQNISQNGFVRSADTTNRFTFGSLLANSQSNPLKAKVYSLSMEYQDATKFLHWLPVRVGTGSTWEGAMMDVLTRRIYRNAGTGAFTWGNDLRYPIPSE